MMRKWIPLALIVVAVVISIVAYPKLPDQVPTHWDLSGDVNGWSSRLWGAWMLPLIMAVVWLIMRAIPHIDPRGANYAKFEGMYDWLIILVIAFMLVMHVVVIMGATGSPISMTTIVMPAVGIFIAAMGLLLPKVHPNWFVGIRTPWTLTSDLSWERTHKIGGVLFVALGLLMVVTTLLAPTTAIWVLVIAAVGVTIFLFVYSYQVWKEDPSKR
jgi:uncharacterized membrane protein